MSKETKPEKTKRIISGQNMSRREIIEAVTEPDSVLILERRSKTVAIPAVDSSSETEIEKVIQEAGVAKGSLRYRVIRLFCEEKKASAANVKVFTLRIKNLNDEQLKVVGRLCGKKEFNTTNILKAIQSMRKFDGVRLLSLRAFIDLEGIEPGPLNQFFMASLPQSSRKEVGKEAYEDEVREKMMTPDQINVFYNICYQIEGITPSNALTLLPRVRKLKSQHTEMINSFLRKGAVFGEKPISNDNIMNLVKLWLILPELSGEKLFKRLVKRISGQPDKKKDFQYIVQTYKDEILKERSGGDFFSFISRIFG